MWGIIPAAGLGSRIQPLAFSKELLPVGARLDEGTERPRAGSGCAVERPVLFGPKLMVGKTLRDIEVKGPSARTHGVRGAFKLPGRVFHELRALWGQPERHDEYIGTLVNAYLRRGGKALGIRAGE